jgi:serine/threonine-protein kinase
MELVEGATLREILLAGPLPLRKVLGIATQVADGLSKAHGAGIVHRDLKPANLMVSTDGYVKILDFGLAKLVADVPEASGSDSRASTLAKPLSDPGTVLGTVSCMSPEQAAAQPLDFRSRPVRPRVDPVRDAHGKLRVRTRNERRHPLCHPS